MVMTSSYRQALVAGMECQKAKRDELAAALRLTYALHERSELLSAHAEACRHVSIFEAELAKA